MITVLEAKQLISQNRLSSRSVVMPLLQALNKVLSHDVIAPVAVPPFHQSAMDGYAFNYDSWNKGSIKIIGEVQAGQQFNQLVEPNEAVRIFTGAPLPDGTDTVVIQEKVKLSEGHIEITDEQLTKGRNVRQMGSQNEVGQVVLHQKQRLSPAAISYLASMGIAEVSVYDQPKIHLIITGSELVQAGSSIDSGKIYESNSSGLLAGLTQLQLTHINVSIVSDEPTALTEAIAGASEADMLILTGGVSVGVYDLVPAALAACQTEKIFHHVKQRPGHPFYFGRMNQTMVFALPGNPAAVMCCLYIYIVPAIRAFMQLEPQVQLFLPLEKQVQKKVGLTYFLKAKMNTTHVCILDHQESYRLDTFALADCLVILEEERSYYEAQELVEVMPLFSH